MSEKQKGVRVLRPQPPAKPNLDRMRRFSNDFEAATKAYKLCSARVWSIFVDLLPVDQKITRHEDHLECTYDFCELSTRNFTSVSQRHECLEGEREKCQPLKELFNGKILNQAAIAGKSTVWTLDGRNTLPLSEPFMAISHVWSDGTGTGAWPAGQVNECLYSFFRRFAYQFKCEGIWWDTLCIPQDKAARAISIQTMDGYYLYARVTLVHDVFLREWLWSGAKSACIAILLSPWFSRGWTALELARSRRVKVIFKGPDGPIVKDLDEDILAKVDDETTDPTHWTVSEIIRNLRKGVSDLNGLVKALGPRYTSWSKDMAVISGLLVGVDVGLDSSGGDILQQEIYRRVMARIGHVYPGHLFHNTATMADQESWCPRTLLQMPIAVSGEKLHVDENLNLSGLWEYLYIQNPIMFRNRVVWNGVHQYTRNKIEQHLLEADDCILLAEIPAMDQPIILREGLERAILVKEVQQPAGQPIYKYIGALYFKPPLSENDFRAAGVIPEYKSLTIQGLSREKYGKEGVLITFQDIEGWTGLHERAWTGNFRTVFEDGYINTQDKQGRQPLHLAAERGNEAVVKFILEQPSLLSCSDFSGKTVLHYAAFGGSLLTVDLLLLMGFDPQARDNNGNTPLHLAAEQGHKCIVQRLLNVILENSDSVGWKDSVGLTPTHLAAYHGHEEVVECLVAAGADVTAAESRLGWTPLHFASLNGYYNIVESLLLLYGASGTVRGDKIFWTPFHCAAVSNNKTLMNLFYEHGTEVNTTDVRGWTPLELASALGHDISYLSLDIDLTKSSSNRKFSLLHHMAAYGPDAIRRIIYNPADIYWEGLVKGIDVAQLPVYRNANHLSILRCSVVQNQQTVLQQLFEEGTDINMSYDNQRTPLHLAVENNSVDMVKFLIQKGADVTAIDAEGKSLLHYVAETGHVQMFNLLMESGKLSIEHKDKGGQTPLYTATHAVKPQIVKSLLEAGANPNTKDRHKRTPLFCLIEYRSWMLFSDLLEHGAHPDICREFASEESKPKSPTSFSFKDLLPYKRRTDLDNRYNVDYVKPLLWDIQHERLSIFKELLERGADPNMKKGDMTPLMLAVEERDEAIVEILLDKGADPETPVRKITPLRMASACNETNICTILSTKGANTGYFRGQMTAPLPKLAYLSRRDLRDSSLLPVLIPRAWRGSDQDIQTFLENLKKQSV